MKRRSFIRNISSLGLASVAVGTSFAAETPQSNSLPGKSKIPVYDGWDVIVVGGGPSGCAGLLNAWCPFTDGEKIIYKGIAERVFSESKKGVPHIHYDNWVPINGEYLKVVYDDLVTSEGVSVLFFTTMAAVEMKRKGVVDAIVVANKAGLSTYKAKVYIDCTGDGDLAAWAGADFVIGDESGSVQEGTLCFTLSNVDPYEFSLIGNVHTNRKDGPIHSIYGNPKYPLVKDKHMNDKLIGPGILGFNAGHVTVDSTDPVSLTEAMIKGRKLVRQLHEGLVEFESGKVAG